MRRNKRPAQRLKRTFFLFGLVTALFLTHTALSFKTYYSVAPIGTLEVEDEISDPTVITIRKGPEMPAAKEMKKRISKEIKQIFTPIIVVDDGSIDDEEEEGSFDDVFDESEEADQPIQAWPVLDRKPIFKGCEKLKDDDQRMACFESKIARHVVENFEMDPNFPSDEKIVIHFVIGTDGKVTEAVCSRGAKRDQIEAERVIKMLPEFIPARYKGKDVATRYTLPISIKN